MSGSHRVCGAFPGDIDMTLAHFWPILGPENGPKMAPKMASRDPPWDPILGPQIRVPDPVPAPGPGPDPDLPDMAGLGSITCNSYVYSYKSCTSYDL